MKTYCKLTIIGIVIFSLTIIATPIDATSNNNKENSGQSISEIDQTANSICREFVKGMVLEKESITEKSKNANFLPTTSVFISRMDLPVTSSIRDYESYSALINDAQKYVHKKFSIMDYDPILQEYRQERDEILSRIHFMYSEPDYPGQPFITFNKSRKKCCP